jgi:hypothetical protein
VTLDAKDGKMVWQAKNGVAIFAAVLEIAVTGPGKLNVSHPWPRPLNGGGNFSDAADAAFCSTSRG